MNIIIYGFTLFFIGFFIHVTIWKIHLPRKQTACLLAIFLAILVLGVFAQLIMKGLSVSEVMRVCLLFISISMAYITTYSAIEADSPSLVIVLEIDKSGRLGLNKETLAGQLNDYILVKPRVRNLLRDKLIYLDDNRYRLTKRGRLLAGIFIIYRRLLNAEKGG